VSKTDVLSISGLSLKQRVGKWVFGGREGGNLAISHGSHGREIDPHEG